VTCIGRFAPSPTGDLHLGSLVAALASYLDARARGGRWLLRIDDLDTPRAVPGAADRILRTLLAFGFEHDGRVAFQSTCRGRYAAALEVLRRGDKLFACDCSRSRIAAADGEQCCVADCRQRAVPEQGASLRACLRGLARLEVPDRSLGPICFDPAVHRDVVVRRRDGIEAYHLAVVVDDDACGVTDVVRGADLLEATGWQLGLQVALGLSAPAYLHVPVVTEPDGAKLAKSRRTVALDAGSVMPLLRLALGLLSQPVPDASGPEELLHLAARGWDPARFRGRSRIALTEQAPN
jgi:glutamyl-Q tRNA(Asp) synthetase